MVYGGFRELASLNYVMSSVKSLLKHKPRVVTVDLLEALGRFLAEDVTAHINIPPYNRSVVDGYAVRSIDTFGASLSNPVILRVKAFIRVGESPEIEIGPGEAVEVSTGARLPRGADAVLMYEKTRRLGDIIEVLEPVPPYGNVSKIGEDIREGEVVLRRGMRLMPWDIAVLASLGLKTVNVYEVRVAVASIGSELVELDNIQDIREVLDKNLVVNSNKYSMIAQLRSSGFTPHYIGIIPDNIDEIASRLREAIAEYDAVLTMGGASVGKVDYTIEAVRRLNPEILIHGVHMRPGRANSIAVIKGKPVFMLSGFPVASIVGFEALVKPILLYMVNGNDDPKPKIKGILTRRVNTPINVRSYVRVRVYRKNDGIYVEPLALTGSGVLSTLVRGNGILIVPEDREGYDEGDIVEVTLLREVFEG